MPQAAAEAVAVRAALQQRRVSLSLSVVCALALSFQSADSKFCKVATLPVGALRIFLSIYFDKYV